MMSHVDLDTIEALAESLYMSGDGSNAVYDAVPRLIAELRASRRLHGDAEELGELERLAAAALVQEERAKGGEAADVIPILEWSDAAREALSKLATEVRRLQARPCDTVAAIVAWLRADKEDFKCLAHEIERGDWRK